MTKLETLYASIKGLQDLGLPLNQETQKAADELEEQLIKTEILPALSKDIEPLLSQIQRELVLVVEYKPGKPISVALSRKVKISDFTDAKRLNLDASNPHKKTPAIVKQEPVNNRDEEILRLLETKDFYVTFADGTKCVGHNASSTMVMAINQMLLYTTIEKMASIDITIDKLPMISPRPHKDAHMSYHQLSNGWWVNTHMNNKSKKEKLERLAQHCNIKIAVHFSMKKR